MKYLTRTVWVLSFISLFNDISSEMLYPVLPLFLQSIGFTALMIGILEGLAEATAGISKGYFGAMSDARGSRLRFVRLGYLLTAVAKPMMTLFTFPAWIFTVRTMDRLGKGGRTAARDAILSDESTTENKGKVFGFHRGMDTLGAAIGPAIALLLLFLYPGQYRLILLIAFVPGILGVALTFLIPAKTPAPQPARRYNFFAAFTYFKHGNARFRKVATGLLIFALFNSLDMFLLLKIRAGGLDEKYVIGVYIYYNLVYAAASFPLGAIGDRLGLKNMYVFGLALFAAAYALVGATHDISWYFAAFFLYGVYAAATDGVSKALISTVVPKSETASAIGSVAGLTSLMALTSSSLTGLVWNYISGETALLVSAGGALVAAAYMIFIPLQKQ